MRFPSLTLGADKHSEQSDFIPRVGKIAKSKGKYWMYSTPFGENYSNKVHHREGSGSGAGAD